MGQAVTSEFWGYRLRLLSAHGSWVQGFRGRLGGSLRFPEQRLAAV